ncbi:MAG TPA: hypothetical protein VF334_23895 [Polyangia bacterium]
MRAAVGTRLLVAALLFAGCKSSVSVGARAGVGGDALCTSTASPWQTALVDKELAGLDPFGSSTSLAADGSDHIAIAYADEALRLATYDPTIDWSVRTFETFGRSFEDGVGATVRLDSMGRPVVAVAHRSGPSSADVRLGDGTELTLPMNGGVDYDVALALDAADRPRVAFDDSDRGLGYAEWDGSSWHVEEIEPTVGLEVALALDAAGRPTIAHSTIDFRLEVARRGDDGRWTVETVAIDGKTQMHSPSLVVDALGVPELAWIDQTKWTLEYAVRGDGGWQIETVGCAGEAASVSLALDAVDQPHVAFAARTGTSGAGRPTPLSAPVQEAVRAGGSWSVETVSDAAQSAMSPSLAIGADGVARVSWYDVAAGSIRYAARR